MPQSLSNIIVILFLSLSLTLSGCSFFDECGYCYEITTAPLDCSEADGGLYHYKCEDLSSYGCSLEERCTDLGQDTASDTLTKTDTATDTDIHAGVVCKNVCVGELKFCNDLAAHENECSNIPYCDWMANCY
ncbi:MAG: hypothetical protein JXR91_02265 [Deltaproteobacteria bacterium]|nr:hypothetical protein [Deltaproteobacteria bacterium]